MKILLLGASGQLGWELTRTCPRNIELATHSRPDVDFMILDSIRESITSAAPDWIINAAAYTAVDRAEEDKKTAFRINHLAVEKIAGLCKLNSISLVQISTDFIFDGTSGRPFLPSDSPNPLSAYGDSKLKGEQAVGNILDDQALIIRTAWLYSSHGSNFVKTMISLMRQKDELSVIDEQIGTPTWAFGLAQAVWDAVSIDLKGIYHWTDAGVASWYDFAVAIYEDALNLGILDKQVRIRPVPVKSFPTKARRPFYSVLDKTSFWKALNTNPQHWRVQLRKMLKELTN